VARQYDVRAIRYLYSRDLDAKRRKLLDFTKQRRWIDDRPAADEEFGVGIERARRNDSQRQFRLADDDRMTGVVATAETRDDVVLLGVEIDDPAFSFVAPLNPNDDIGLRAGITQSGTPSRSCRPSGLRRRPGTAS
jgi:hypothetical protein